MNVKLDFSIQEIKHEVRHLIDMGMLDRHQPIHALGQFFSKNEWALIECELEANGYSLITNNISDLVLDP